MKAIEQHLIPLGFTLPQPSRDVVGGYFVWLRLPSELSAPALAKSCKDDGSVIIAPGRMFEVPGDDAVKFNEHIRLCFAWEEEWKLAEGVKRVAEIASKTIEDVKHGVGNGYVIVEKDGTAGDSGEVNTFK